MRQRYPTVRLLLTLSSALPTMVVCHGIHHSKFLVDGVLDRPEVIPNEFIVKFNSSAFHLRGGTANVTSIMQSLLRPRAPLGHVTYGYDYVFKGAAIRGVQDSELLSILDSPLIEYAIPNEKVQLYATQYSPDWGLDRIDQSQYPLSSSYDYNFTGKNVEVFIIDTGIWLTHSEFRAKTGVSRAKCGFNAIEGEECQDWHGHGTHVAGILGATTFGVAKDALLTAVKALNMMGDGDMADVIAGLNYVVGRKKKAPTKPMVINMSIGFTKSDPLNTAVNAAVDAGIFVAVAAGNAGEDACKFSPASASKAMTVGALQENTYEAKLMFESSRTYDFAADYSNVGRCVDVFAPGTNILSSVNRWDYATGVMSGTSMASPMVAGVAALYLSKDPKSTPATIMTNIKNTALKANIGVFQGSWTSSTPNLALRVQIPR